MVVMNVGGPMILESSCDVVKHCCFLLRAAKGRHDGTIIVEEAAGSTVKTWSISIIYLISAVHNLRSQRRE